MILPPDAKQWLCDKPFTPTAVPKNTRCFLTCNDGFGSVQGKYRLVLAAIEMRHFIVRHESGDLLTINHFKKVTGHFIDAELTENGNEPIKLIKNVCENVSNKNKYLV